MRKTLSKRLETGLIAFALVLSQVLMPVQSAYASHGGNNTNNPPAPKVDICHRTASNSNPYVLLNVAQDSVDGNAANDNGQGDHYLEHTGPIWPATGPDGKWGDIIPAIPGVHGGLNWDAQGQAIWNNDCVIPPTKIPVPTPEVNDPCGPGNATWVVPEDTDQIDWRLSNGRLSATAKDGFVFENGETRIYFGYAPDSGVECDKEIEVPAMPSVNDPCGLDNASWNVPADGNNVTWAVVGGELIATADDGYVFVGGSKTYNFGVAKDSGELCKIPVPTPEVKDECNVDGDNAMWIVPEDTKEITWKLHDGKLFAIANADYIFENGEVKIYFGYAKDNGIECTTPEEPTQVDVCGVENDTFTIPESDSVKYYVNGKYVPAGTYPAFGEKLYVKAVAKDGYEVLGQYKWKLKFTNEYCDPFTPEIYKTNQHGDLLAGAVFDIEVCQMVRHHDDKDQMNMSLVLDEQDGCVTYEDVDLGLDGQWFANNVEYKEYVPTTVTITETQAPGTCVAGGPWTFAWSYPPKEEEGPYNEEMFMLNRESNNYPRYDDHYGKVGAWENGTNVWYLENNCPTGGSGGQTPDDPEEPAKTVTEVVQELPHTGPGGTFTTIIALLTAMVTYGAVYFAQPKRQLED